METVKVPTDELMQVVLLQLQTGGMANLTVTGFSMMPMLRNLRDSVQLVPVTKPLKAGDVALYRRDTGRYILHRVIKVTENEYLFCGDNQADLEPVRQDQLIAYVSGFTAKGRKHSLTERRYRLYTAMCVDLFCLRKPYIAIRRGIGGIYTWLSNRRKQK